MDNVVEGKKLANMDLHMDSKNVSFQMLLGPQMTKIHPIMVMQIFLILKLVLQ